MKGFGYLVKEGLKNVWSNRIMSIASICVLISCLVLTGAASLFSVNVSKVVDSVGDSNETKVYIEDGYSQLEAVYIGKDIEKISNVKSAEFYSKDEAIKQYREELGEELFAQMQEGDNPLPDAFIVVMDDLSLYDQTVAEIEKIEGVDSISNQGDIAERLTDISNLVNVISFWVIIALTVISIFIIANTIRATMYSRRFEISIMKSVGATNSFVRLPFLVEGMTIGLVSAIVSTLAMVFLYEGVMNAISSAIPFSYIPLQNVIFFVAIAFVVAGMAIGFFGSFISIRKYLKMEGNEILGW
ncbi:MAG: permease-like cell division protein FtsX [Ruminococcus sp.]|nr:permease-like cell division protein FtsX [Ruminococcus sp.]